MQERLQKIISRAGLASRRAGEELILAGRVRVNGTVITELGAKANLFADKIEVDGQKLMPEKQRYIVLHKPRNVVSTLSDPEGRPTVGELLKTSGSRLYPVGRLDFATSGVLLATNDGDFANALLHPRGGVPKTYVLKVNGLMQDEDLDRWRTGVKLEDGMTLPAQVRLIRHEEDKTWLEITLREGRNQQIRRMGDATGFPVMRLARTSFAGVTSEGLRPGEQRSLTVDELVEIRKQFGVPKRMPKAGALQTEVPARGRSEKPQRARAERAQPAARSEKPARGRSERAQGARGERPQGARSDRPQTARTERPQRGRPERVQPAEAPAGRQDQPRRRSPSKARRDSR